MANRRPVLNLSSRLPRFLLFIALISPLFFLVSFSTDVYSLDGDVLRYTNQYRRSNGLAALTMRNDLNAIARKHSEDMAKGRCSFGHAGFDQRYSRIKKIFQSCTVAENVAYGSRTGKEVVDEWKSSSGHRRNMLGKYKYIGIGTARDSRGRIYYTQLFVK
jgi:uncharacterized protein YkwD